MEAVIEKNQITIIIGVLDTGFVFPGACGGGNYGQFQGRMVPVNFGHKED